MWFQKQNIVKFQISRMIVKNLERFRGGLRIEYIYMTTILLTSEFRQMKTKESSFIKQEFQYKSMSKTTTYKKILKLLLQ